MYLEGVPRFIAAAALAIALFSTVAGAAPSFDAAAWDRLLAKYVDGEGRVDYARLRATAADRRALDALYAGVAAVRADRVDEAFYLNAYNVVVWKNVVDHSPKRVDEDGFLFFKRRFVIARRPMDLDTLEKQVIRPRFHDARVHVALNCASAGCPSLPREAFRADRLSEQLDREARRFCNQRRNVDWDAASSTVKLSKIFEWYRDDFDGGRVIAWINRYRTDEIPEGAKVVFVDYDWRLNDPSLRR